MNSLEKIFELTTTEIIKNNSLNKLSDKLEDMPSYDFPHKI